MPFLIDRRGVLLAGLLAAVPMHPALAVDLTVQEIEVTQAVQYGTTPLIANNVTYVRARIGVADGFEVEDVDATLRVLGPSGNELPWSPVRSINGPITVTPGADEVNLDAWINFLIVMPSHDDVSISVEVNPLRTIEESTFENNVATVSGLTFECRGTVDIAYVPIDYTHDGSGLPDPELIEPGIGDGFVRAIYSVGEWNYYRSPLPPLVWSKDINDSDVDLLNVLQDIRLNQLPGAGVTQPDFIFGWLPGNPYAANGRAISVPGDTAFGNTEPIRHQRTFAHELGHLFGLGHNVNDIETVGIDTEHHLYVTQGLSQVFPSDRKDVMVAGLLTQDAFVDSGTYNAALNDPRTMCGIAAAAPAPMLRVCGVLDHDAGTATLEPVMRIERGRPTAGAAPGGPAVVSRSAEGEVLTVVPVDVQSTRAPCAAVHAALPLRSRSSFHVLVPPVVRGVEVATIEIVTADGRVLASRTRSASAPVVELTYVGPAGGGANVLGGRRADPLVGPVSVRWSGSDADGDALTYNLLYSFDDGSGWLPLALGRRGTAVELDASLLPGSPDGRGRLRLVASDGLNNTTIESGGIALGDNGPPDVHLFTPNDGTTWPLAAPIAFHASVWDREEGMLDDIHISWHSNRDGPLGTGRLLVIDNLSIGTHQVTVRSLDSAGGSSFDTVQVEITPRDVFDADVNDDATVDVEDLVEIVVGWGPCPGGPDVCPADVTGDGRVDVADMIEVVFTWSGG